MLPLHYFGDPILRTKAKEIAEVTPEIQALAREMVEAMIHYNGVGIAGPQIGKLFRIYIVRDEWCTPNGDYVLGPPEVIINPILSSPSKEMEEMVEGCVSLPGVPAKVRRPKKIHVRHQTVEGTWVEKDLEGFLARVHMHENDHLNGVLHIDRADPKDRPQIERALRRMKIPKKP